MISWGRPEFLWALAALVPLAALLLGLRRRRERRLAELADRDAWPVLLPARHPGRERLRLALTLAALACGLAALARPQWGFRWEEVRRRGLDLMLVLDTSNSMRTDDLRPSRFAQARWGVRDLVRRLRGDRVGLVAFAGGSFLQCPLTSDYSAFLMTLDDLRVGAIPRGGTAIAQGLRTALDNLPPGGSADRAILLVTDGEDHEGDPLALVPDLKARGVRVFAVGIGTPDGGLVPDESGQGSGYLKDREGLVVKSSLREDVLERLALETGGAYVRSAPGDVGLERLYEEGVSKLKRDEQESRMSRAREERFGGFIALALALLAVEAAVPPGRRIPAAAPAELSAGRRRRAAR